MKRLIAFLLVAILAFPLVACGGGNNGQASNETTAKKIDDKTENVDVKKDEELFIGLSLPTFQEERWTIDAKAIEAYCEEKGIKLVSACADGDSNKQKEQCATMLTQGIDVLILAPNDGNAAAAIVEDAKKDGVYVISYDRLVTGTNLVDVYVSFDSWYMGGLEGNYIVDKLKEKYGEPKGNIVVLKGDPADSCAPLYYGGAIEPLKPYIDSGAINVISENDCIGWKVEDATKHVENAMSIAASKDITIDAVLAPNDGTAGGTIAALGDDVAKETIITGMDAEVAACQRIIAGTQSMTSWGDTRMLGQTAVNIAIDLVEKGTFKADSTSKSTDADGNEIDVPTALVEAKFIDKDNIDILIQAEYLTREQIYGE